MAFSVVQKAFTADGTASTLTTLTLNNTSSGPLSTITTGNAIMGEFEYSATSQASITSIVAGSNTCVLKNHLFDSTNTNGVVGYEFVNIAGSPTSLVVTVAASPAVSFARVTLIEVSGITSFDISTAQLQAGPGTSSSSGNITPSAAGEFLYGDVANTSGGTATTFTVGSGFTIENNLAGAANSMADEQQTDAQSVAIAATFGNNRGTDSYYTGIMAFAGAASGIPDMGARNMMVMP